MLKNADMKSEHKSTGGKERYAMSRLQEMGLCIFDTTGTHTNSHVISGSVVHFFLFCVRVLIIA